MNNVHLSNMFIASCFSVILTIINTNGILFASAIQSAQQDQPTIFPEGANTLFMGHSFFIPVSKQFNSLVDKKEYPNHSFEDYAKGGEKGSPIYLWDNHLNDIEDLLKGKDVELFGMTVHSDPYYAEEEAIVEMIDAYKRWIDLAVSYNPHTSFFIGVPWLDFPSSYDATTYMTKMQEAGDTIYNTVIEPLRDMYPNTHIYYLNYGIISAAMKNLYEKNELFDITVQTQDESTNKFKSLYVDEKGHGGNMLLKLSGIAWYTWLYEGYDFPTLAKNLVDEDELIYNEQNIIDIYQVVEEVNQDYRLYGGVNTMAAKSAGSSTKFSHVFSIVILVSSAFFVYN